MPLCSSCPNFQQTCEHVEACFQTLFIGAQLHQHQYILQLPDRQARKEGRGARPSNSRVAHHQGIWKLVSRLSIRSSRDSNSEMMRPCGLGHAFVTATCVHAHLSLSCSCREQERIFHHVVCVQNQLFGYMASQLARAHCTKQGGEELTKVLLRQRSWASSGSRSCRKVERTVPRRPRVPFTRQSAASTRHASVTC